MCGADGDDMGLYSDEWGSSPRVRSRHANRDAHRGPAGIISACAEQTRRSSNRPTRAKDHLRVCGADQVAQIAASIREGSSPRVRSRLVVQQRVLHRGGIISACAEQTWTGRRRGLSARDHLRVCGADDHDHVVGRATGGSSPRVRSRLRARLAAAVEVGIISACAEQTRSLLPLSPGRRDHLRVCGADVVGIHNET